MHWRVLANVLVAPRSDAERDGRGSGREPAAAAHPALLDWAWQVSGRRQFRLLDANRPPKVHLAQISEANGTGAVRVDVLDKLRALHLAERLLTRHA